MHFTCLVVVDLWRGSAALMLYSCGCAVKQVKLPERFAVLSVRWGLSGSFMHDMEVERLCCRYRNNGLNKPSMLHEAETFRSS